MRFASLAVRALLAGALGAGLLVAGSAPATADDDLVVTPDGVAFDGKKIEREDRDQRLDYSIRSLAGLDYARLTESMEGARRGYVAFSTAPAEMPDGYCVTYVRVPGVGEWRESLLDQRCTDPAATPSPTATPSPSPTGSVAEPSRAATSSPDGPREEPSPSAEPTPEPTPTPSASPSPEVSPSASPTAVAPGEAMHAEQFEALGRSFSGDPSAVGERHRAADDEVTDGELWAMTGLGLAAVGLVAGGVIVWRMRRRSE